MHIISDITAHFVAVRRLIIWHSPQICKYSAENSSEGDGEKVGFIYLCKSLMFMIGLHQ